MYYIAKTMPRI